MRWFFLLLILFEMFGCDRINDSIEKQMKVKIIKTQNDNGTSYIKRNYNGQMSNHSNMNDDFDYFGQYAFSKESPMNVTLNKSDQISFRVMTYNVWHFDSPILWFDRLPRIVKVINEGNPDIIGLNEIRDDWTGTRRNQLLDLLEHLPQFQYYHYQRSSDIPDSTTEEGIGLASKWPILAVEYMNLGINATFDGNRRIVVKTLIDTPFGQIDFYVTHWSYSRKQQLQNALDSIDYLSLSRQAHTQFFVGDLNIYPDYEFPMRVLSGRVPYKSLKGSFSDTWDILYPNNSGWTFSNLLAQQHVMARPDRILMTSAFNQCVLINATILGVPDFLGIDESIASDHRALVVDVSCHYLDSSVFQIPTNFSPSGLNHHNNSSFYRRAASYLPSFSLGSVLAIIVTEVFLIWACAWRIKRPGTPPNTPSHNNRELSNNSTTNTTTSSSTTSV